MTDDISPGGVFTFNTSGKCAACSKDATKILVAVCNLDRSAKAALACADCSDRVFNVLQEYLGSIVEQLEQKTGIMH